MSYHTWSVDGFGVCIDETVKHYTKDSIRNFLELAPEVKKSFDDWINNLGNLSDEEFIKAVEEDYESEWNCTPGIAGLIQDVFVERFGNHFEVCDDFDGVYYLLYTPTYPWYANDIERDWTESKIDEMITGALQILDPEYSATANYQSVENGG